MLTLDHALEELAALAALHDQAHCVLCLVYVHKMRYMWMVHAEVDARFVRQSLFLSVINAREPQNLHRESATCRLVLCHEHIAVTPFAELPIGRRVVILNPPPQVVV